MAIDPRTGMMIAGGVFGAYSSDIFDNPVSGLVTTGIGIGMGAFMTMPEYSLKDLSKVNVGAKIDPDFIQQTQDLANTPYDYDSFQKRIDKLEKRTGATLERRLAKLQAPSSIKPLKAIQREVKSLNLLEQTYQQELARYDTKATELIEKKKAFHQEMIDLRAGNIPIHEANAKTRFYNRMIDREHKSMARYLDSASGQKQVANYTTWLERHKGISLDGMSLDEKNEIMNNRLKEYMTENPESFSGIRKREKYYSQRMINDRKDLFNPWFFDYKKSNADELADMKVRLDGSLRSYEHSVLEDTIRAKGYSQNEYERRKQVLQDRFDEKHIGYLNNYESRLEDYNNKVAKVTTKYQREEGVYNNVRDLLRNNGINVQGGRENVLHALRGLKDETLIDRVNLLLNNSDAYFLKQSELNVKTWESNSKKIGTKDPKGELISWFKNQLGHDVLDAQDKANMFLKLAEEDSIHVRDGIISFNDKTTGSRVTVPLTSYGRDGTRYHNRGKGNFSVAKQYNPYIGAYNEGREVNVNGVKRLVTAQDIVKGYDAETMLKYLPEGQSVASMLPKIESLFHYNSQEAGVISNDPNSIIFKNNQHVLDLGETLRFDQYGEIDTKYPFRKLELTGSKDKASELQQSFFKLANELPPDQALHLTSGLSLNNLTSINTKGYNPLNIMANNERGDTSVGNRGTSVVHKNEFTKSVEQMIGSNNFNKQFSSSQVLSRMDVENASLFNSISSAIFGNDAVLGDGAGFYNMGEGDSFHIRDRSILKIPLSNNMAIANADLIQALTSKEGLSKYLETNPINIGNDAIAYDEKGRPISLNKMYSNGTIVDGFLTDDSLRIVTEADYMANAERNVKLYSTGSKSLATGIASGVMGVQTEIALLTNAGRLQQVAADEFILDGQTIKGAKELHKILAQNFQDRGIQTPMFLLRAEDNGSQKIRKMIADGAKGNKVYDLLVENGSDSRTAAMTAALFSEHKAATDLKTSLAYALNDPQHKGAFRQSFLFYFDATNLFTTDDKLGFLQRANNLVAQSGIIDDYMEGKSLTVGSFNKGASIVGAGNRAKLSWAALTQLRTSGFTNADLEKFGMKDQALLYELRSISDERRKSVNSINGDIRGKEGRFLNMLRNNTEAHERTDRFKTLFGNDSKGSYLTYNLSFEDHKVKSLNFATIDTTRSGFYEEAGVKTLKDWEKRKVEIMSADLQYRESTDIKERSIIKSKLVNLLDDYETFVSKMLSGDNNLLKAGVSMYSDSSSIMQVKYIGGNADKFATSMMNKGEHAWFISEDEAAFKAKQLGGTLEYQTTQYSNIKQAMLNKNGTLIPLSSLVTREPAQGPLSSDLIQWFVDTSIGDKVNTNRNNAFVALSNVMYYKGMIGDGDQDTVQTLLGDFKDKNEFNALNDRRRPIRQAFLELTNSGGIVDAMGVKGKDIGMSTILDFESVEELANHRMAAARKGRNRKTLAATATGLTVAYSKALELELGDLDSTDKRLTQGRVMIHSLVENLLKSAKLSTDDFQLVTEQDVERLHRFRQGYLGKDGFEGVTRKAYDSELRKTLPDILGLNNPNLAPATKQQGFAIMEDVIKAELNQSQRVGNMSFTPLDLNEKRFSKDSTDFINSLNSIIKEQGITDVDLEDGIRHLRKSTGQVALGTSDYLMDIVKSNKGLIAGGLAAMAGVALVGREAPSFSDSRANARQHGASMLRSPGTYDQETINNAPMGAETNSTKSNFILPKAFQSKGIKIAGDLYNTGQDAYMEYDSMLSVENVQDQMQSIANSIFGNGVRSARLQTN